MRTFHRIIPNNKRHRFNYRIPRAWKNVECVFSILNAKFKIPEGPVCSKEGTVYSVVKTSVLNHNIEGHLK
jgi:hypothetical protein